MNKTVLKKKKGNSNFFLIIKRTNQQKFKKSGFSVILPVSYLPIQTQTIICIHLKGTRNACMRLRPYICAQIWIIWMRSSLVVRASDCQCTSCNGPGFDPSIRRHSGIWGAADEAVLNIVLNKREKIPPKNIEKKNVNGGVKTKQPALFQYLQWQK